jgi:hypothetical protein
MLQLHWVSTNCAFRMFENECLKMNVWLWYSYSTLRPVQGELYIHFHKNSESWVPKINCIRTGDKPDQAWEMCRHIRLRFKRQSSEVNQWNWGPFEDFGKLWVTEGVVPDKKGEGD